MGTRAPFEHLPTEPATQLRLWLQWSALRLRAHLCELGGPESLNRYPFIEMYAAHASNSIGLSRTADEFATAWRLAVRRWESELPPASVEWPISRLLAFGLSENQLLTLAMAMLADEDARFAGLYSEIQPSGADRLTVGLLSDLLGIPGPFEGSGWPVASQLIEDGFLVAGNADGPRASRTLRVPGPIADAFRGPTVESPAPMVRYHEPILFPLPQDIDELLPGATSHTLRRAAVLLGSGRIGGLVVRGPSGSGRTAVVGGVAGSLGRGLLVLETQPGAEHADGFELLGPLATLYGALPVVKAELAPSEVANIPPLRGYRGPIGFILGREGALPGGQAANFAVIPTGFPAPAARRKLWRQAANCASEETLDHLAAQYCMTAGAIKETGHLAMAYAALDGRERVDAGDVQEACRSVNGQLLDSLAARIETEAQSDCLVLAEPTRRQVDHLLLRCRNRELLLEHLGDGFGSSANRGVRAMFSGPSGTGKTLAARFLAGQLGLDLYRVDLASVVDKYVGETERNLSRVFARAEERDVVLLLDEGDSLMTGRTDVRTANDRYANMETNYLLQRIESYSGILVVTTNAASRIDSAFQRRIDIHVEFTLPDANERLQLWHLHLPGNHEVPLAFLHEVALRCSLNGGQIRNAAGHATLLAIEGRSPVNEHHVRKAVATEYQKLGAGSPIGGVV